ncbi:MAG TPA: cytochrome-c peroxidase [Kofleriaceae bacterium]|nr:cytochrome-c peroxidase [Kofleriaceae bacterium]
MRISTTGFVFITALSLAACKKNKATDETPANAPLVKEPATAVPTEKAEPAAPVIDRGALAAYAVLPAVFENPDNPLTDAKIELGRRLYFDKRLSKNQDLSCNSCHGLDTYGVDNQPTSSGHKSQRGSRNSPTVYNAAGHLAQFWDGRSPHVEHQATQPVLNPVEMAMASDKVVLAVLKSIPEYGKAFADAFPNDKAPVTYDNFGKAIGAFERKLVTPSRWDKFLSGDDAALSAEEKRGFLTFTEAGCTTCHTGVNLGGHMYQKAGLVKPWPNQKDLGRFDVTKAEADKLFFKVPSLRNIDKTAPYFHDGSVADLPEAVKLMASHQLGKDLTETQISEIVTWLRALTGELPAEYIKEPTPYPSGKTTPKPDPS